MTKKILSTSIAYTLAALVLAGCGGGSSGTTGANLPGGNAPEVPANPPAPPTPTAIQGIATPSSVAVVTATNAN